MQIGTFFLHFIDFFLILYEFFANLPSQTIEI